MARIFAYIVHKSGVADDSAAELAAAARKIDPAQLADRHCHRLGRGSGRRLREPPRFLRRGLEDRQRSRSPIPMPNWSARRWSRCCRAAASCWFRTTHFGIDLSPGLSIKLNAAFVSDVVDIDGVEGAWLEAGPPGIRRTGQRARALRHFHRAR